MYGKHFESMYTGSMVGRGSIYFAVWGYVISHFRPSKKYGALVELNPKYLALVLGEEEKLVEKVIREFCSPDPDSRSKVEGGRKLIQMEQYMYRVVNGAYYRALRSEDERREYNRNKQEEYRKKKLTQCPNLPPGFVASDDRSEMKRLEEEAQAAMAQQDSQQEVPMVGSSESQQ